MKLYHAYYREYKDVYEVGIFSSRELAQQAAEHCYENKMSNKRFDGTKYCYWEKRDLQIDEMILDQYITENLSPLALAMKEEE